MTEVYLALGSNIKRTASMLHAVKRLSGVLQGARCSRVYRSVPHNNARGPEFYNAVIMGIDQRVGHRDQQIGSLLHRHGFTGILGITGSRIKLHRPRRDAVQRSKIIGLDDGRVI